MQHTPRGPGDLLEEWVARPYDGDPPLFVDGHQVAAFELHQDVQPGQGLGDIQRQRLGDADDLERITVTVVEEREARADELDEVGRGHQIAADPPCRVGVTVVVRTQDARRDVGLHQLTGVQRHAAALRPDPVEGIVVERAAEEGLGRPGQLARAHRLDEAPGDRSLHLEPSHGDGQTSAGAGRSQQERQAGVNQPRHLGSGDRVE